MITACSRVLILNLFLLLLKYSNSISQHPIILIIAFDGFRYDYINKGFTPVLQNLQKNGTSAIFLNNVFPTITSPNFFSIATGLYPETHGVLGNRVFNEQFKCLDTENSVYELFHYNYDVIPLWLLNEINGNGRYSGTILWPGSKFEYQRRISTFIENNESLSLISRIDKAIEWIVDEKTPANLVFLYFNEPDATSHQYGPDSENVNNELRKLDNATEYLLVKLKEYNLRDKINILFLSDHGATEVSNTNIIDLSPYINNNTTFTLCGESPVWQIKYIPGYENEIYENLTLAKNELNTFTMYQKSEIPESWHIKYCRRQADLLLVANTSYAFSDANNLKGDHGYDLTELKMRPFFIANGPLFKLNYTVQSLNSIDIYPLIMKILHLKLTPNYVQPNGTLTSIQHILR